MENIQISVCILTYNHVSYIKQAIEGVLMQKHNYSWEVFIADDCSTDGTAEIINNYSIQFPKLIKVLPRTKNIGPLHNLTDLIKSAKGKYIAICEGDDYWTDPLKLQKQVDFLESAPEFAICFHAIKVLDENSFDKTPVLLNKKNKEVSAIEDLCLGNYIYTPTCVFRNGLIKEFSSEFYKFPLGDWPIHLMNAAHGKIRFINEPMAVYRIHKGGLWSQLGGINLELKCLKTIKMCNAFFNSRYKPLFMKGAIPKYMRLIKLYRKKNYLNAMYYSIKLLSLRKYDTFAITKAGILKLLLLGRV